MGRIPRFRGFVPVVALALVAAIAGPVSPARSTREAGLSPGFASDLGTLPASTDYTAFVHFGAGTPVERHELLAARGLGVVADLPAIDAIAVRGPLETIAALGSHPWVRYLEDNPTLEYYGSTAHWATRVGVVQNAAAGGPYRDAAGNILRGQGIGIAIVDSGADATHPDLANQIVTNYKVPWADFAGLNSDSSSGHGTHVSGIAAGDGTASQGTFKGVAPGAKLHVFAAGEALSVLFAAVALREIHDNYASYVPAIKVVNNSWGNGGGSAYNPNGVIERLVKQLVEDKGVTVVFAAGNDGGNGTSDETNGYCKDPTPGVICVANYDDQESGNRDYRLDASSSRGRNGQPTTYPDISAPGAFYTSTFMPTSGALYGTFIIPDPAWEPFYGDAAGTSMASPHISGIVALLKQAKPTLTPAQVEDVLLDTAYKFTTGGAYEADPQNLGGTTSFDKGAGLADVPLALQHPSIVITGDNAAAPTVLASGDGGDSATFGAADIVRLSALPGLTGVTYEIEVANADQRPPVSIGLRVFANYSGKSRNAQVNLLANGNVTTGAFASSAGRNGNVITMFVPYANVGNPPSASPVHNVSAASYIGVVQDVAPSPTGPATGLDVVLRPLFTPSFTTPSS